MSGVCFSLSLGLRPSLRLRLSPVRLSLTLGPLSGIHRSYQNNGSQKQGRTRGRRTGPLSAVWTPRSARSSPSPSFTAQTRSRGSLGARSTRGAEREEAGGAETSAETGRTGGRSWGPPRQGAASPETPLPGTDSPLAAETLPQASARPSSPRHGTQVIPAAGRPPAPFAATDAAPPQSAGKRWLALHGRKQLETEAGHSKARARSVPTSTCAGSFPWDLILERAGRSKPSCLLT